MALRIKLALEETIANYGSCVGFSGVQAVELKLILDTCSIFERLPFLNISLQRNTSYIIKTFLHLTCLVTDLPQSVSHYVCLFCVNYLRSQLSGDLYVMSAGSHTDKLHGKNNIIT
jgi:hypothetical protein